MLLSPFALDLLGGKILRRDGVSCWMLRMHFGNERTIVDGAIEVGGTRSKVPNGILTMDLQTTTTTQPTQSWLSFLGTYSAFAIYKDGSIASDGRFETCPQYPLQ